MSEVLVDYTELPENEYLSAMWKAKWGALSLLGVHGDPAAEIMTEALWLRMYYRARIKRIEEGAIHTS